MNVPQSSKTTKITGPVSHLPHPFFASAHRCCGWFLTPWLLIYHSCKGNATENSSNTTYVSWNPVVPYRSAIPGAYGAPRFRPAPKLLALKDHWAFSLGLSPCFPRRQVFSNGQHQLSVTLIFATATCKILYLAWGWKLTCSPFTHLVPSLPASFVRTTEPSQQSISTREGQERGFGFQNACSWWEEIWVRDTLEKQEGYETDSKPPTHTF